MSTSRVINRWLNRAYKSIAILLVIFAVLISSLRLFLPYIQQYKVDVEHFINNANDSHIAIGELSMEWEKLGPSIVVKDVSLLETQSTDIFIDQVHIHLDFWQSLLKGRVITQDVTLKGAQVLIKELTVSDDKDEPLINRVTEIFLDRISSFSLLDSQVIFRNNNTTKVLLINQLDWLNDGDNHKGKGYVVVDGLSSNNIKVLLDLQGDDLEDLAGQIYLQANQLNITPWLDTVFAIDNQDTHSAINFDGWLTIEQGLPSSLLIALGNNEISWTHNSSPQFFSVNQGHILANFDNESPNSSLNIFNVFTSPLTFITTQNIWQPTRIEFSKANENYLGYISQLSVPGLIDVSPLFVKNEQVNQLLDNINPQGLIENIFLELTPDQQAVTADYSQVNTSSYSGIPGVSNVAGDLVFHNNTLLVSLSATKGQLDFAEHFVAPIPYNKLSSALRLDLTEDSWALASRNIKFSSDEVELEAEILVEQVKEQDITMSLLSNVTKGDAKFASHYFPHLLMGEELVNYLNGAIVKGQLEQAQILFNGPLNKFPFEKNEGIFTVDAEIIEAEFKFDPAWPAITNLAANLNFTNNSMLITSRNGDLANIDARGAVVQIKDLSKAQILEVDSTFEQVQPKLVERLMSKSPLKNTVGAALSKLSVIAPIAGDFSLSLPLNDPHSAVAKGSVKFNNNTVTLDAPSMLFTQVNGELIYENDKVIADGISLLWRDMPIDLSVNAYDKGVFYDTNITIDAHWNSEHWLPQLPKQLQSYGTGDLNWKGLLALNIFKEGDFTYDLSISSTLAGTQLNLPAPYKKTVDEKIKVNALVTGQTESTTINASAGEQLNFYGVLNHKDVHFSSAHLVLGKEEMLLPRKGFHITTKLAQADIAQWQPLIVNILDAINQQDEKQLNDKSKIARSNLPKPLTLLEAPEHITGKVGVLSYQDYQLSDVQFSLDNNKLNWLLDVNSKEVRTKIILHNDLYEKGIEVDADFIHLAKLSEVTPNEEMTSISDATEEVVEQVSETLSTAEQEQLTLQNQKIYNDLPPLMVKCNSCKIDNLDLGKVFFAIKRNEEQHIILDKFSATRDKLTLQLDGYWSQNDSSNMTHLAGIIHLEDLEQETENLGYTPTIKDSGLESEFSFNWQAAPYEFDVAKLNGQFNAKLDDGFLAEVPDQARVFSVLSLQSLVRKLSFDFRDIFADGMFYRSITGDFQLKDGIMYTDNMFMKGAAGDLEVKGNTDLGKELLDIRMSYKPNVTSSLPALAWIATLNPVTFLAGLALEEVITSKVYYEMNFELTGSMSQPIFKDVDRKTRNISVGKTTPPQIIEETTPPDVSQPITEENNSNSKPIELPKKSEVDG